MPAAQRAVIVKLLREASVEVSGHDLTAAAKLSPWLRPGADVYVNFVPGGSYRQSAEVAAAVRRSGFTPIPHVAARGIRDHAELADFLKRLGGEAAVDRVLVVAGDVLKPLDPSPPASISSEPGCCRRAAFARSVSPAIRKATP